MEDRGHTTKSIAALHREARKRGNIWVDPAKVASLAADPSFNSHISHRRIPISIKMDINIINRRRTGWGNHK